MHLSLRFGASEYSSRMERPRALVRLARTRAAMAFLMEQPIARIPAQSWSGAFGSSLEQEIDRAFERNEFEVFLQPIIHLRSFAIRGAEVLVRWRHPERGLLSPSHFLPMAESTGQVACIGQWVLESVCANASKWGRQLLHRPRFSVNISPVELHDHRFLATTLAILDRYPLHSFEIELEITETAVLASESKTAEVVESLRRQGIKTALDDFGAGYSSLSHLREIPFSKLKIDRTFVHGALASRRCRTIVRSMVELARGLRIEVTAEGVENPEQLRLLYEAGCDEAQGYLFARPMPPHRFDSWVAGYQGKASEAFDRAERQRTETNGKVVPFQRNPSPA
jgi:EAL domain-containing protein (putative c-di-GMP-specific phosphodiesterase class I)